MAEDRDFQREPLTPTEPTTRGTAAPRETVVQPDPAVRQDTAAGEDRDHPVSTGVGMAGGALAGAAVGVVGGPVGMVVGAVAGGAVGAAAGEAAGSATDPEVEDRYWRDNYQREPYYASGRSFDDYGPAYRYGVQARGRYADWTTAEPALASDWERSRGGSSLNWQEAQPAARAAWDRVETHYRAHGDARSTAQATTKETSWQKTET